MGQPTASALTFPSPPLALAAAGTYVLAACQDGVHIYDQASSSWVQSLPFPPDAQPAPGQQLAAAHNATGSCILVAGYRRVRWCPAPNFAMHLLRDL